MGEACNPTERRQRYCVFSCSCLYQLPNQQARSKRVRHKEDCCACEESLVPEGKTLLENGLRVNFLQAEVLHRLFNVALRAGPACNCNLLI